MSRPLRALLVERSDADALVIANELRKCGFEPDCERVETVAMMKAALDEHGWDVVLADNSNPQLGVAAALELLERSNCDVPLFLVTREINTDEAVKLLRSGARDFINKSDLTRLGPAIERELQNLDHRQQAEVRFKHIAYHDPLTGLPNRVLFRDRLAQAVAQAKRSNRLVALHYIDLDQFKLINDTLGHSAGDSLLQEVASRLQKSVRATDTVARLGGDEFAIVQTELSSTDGAACVASKILRAMALPFSVRGQAIHTSASVGVTIYPLDDPLGSRLLENADMAMYRAKAEGRSCYAFFTPALDIEVHVRREIEDGLTQALAKNQLLLHYQPQIDLNTRAIIGMEALVRWQHPTKGLLMPGAFLPAAEASGLILPLSEFVIRHGCKQNQEWQARSSARVRLAINISSSHLRHELLLQTVTEALKESALDPEYLELELTETALIRDEIGAARMIGELARLGILFSIDDFGTGYSSLKYLKQLAIKKLKIDQSFVRNLPHDPDDAVIVRATIALGHQLGLRVIAEGIETDDQFVFLRENGCDEGQGYLFFRPLNAGAMGELLDREGGRAPRPVAEPALALG